jgi:hypothetical protein
MTIAAIYDRNDEGKLAMASAHIHRGLCLSSMSTAMNHQGALGSRFCRQVEMHR